MPESIDYARRLARGTAAVFTGFIVAHLIGLFIRMFFARALSLAEYGLLYGVLTLVSFLTIFRDLGLPPALVKHIPESIAKERPDEIKPLIATTVFIQAVSGLVIATLLFFFSDQIAIAFFRTEAASILLKIFSAWFFFNGFYIAFQASFHGFQRTDVYALMDFTNVFLILIFALPLVGILGHGVGGAASACLLASLVMLSFGLLLLKTCSRGFAGKASLSKLLSKKLFTFAAPVFVHGLWGMVVAHISTLALIAFRPLDEVALFQAALPTAQVIGYLPGAMSIVFFPMVSEIWTGPSRKSLLPALYFLTKFSFILILPLGLVFVAFPDIVLRLLFGTDFVGGAAALQILAMAMVILAFSKIMSATVAGIGRPEIIMKCGFLSGCFAIAGNLLLVHMYGIQGAAIAHALTFMLSFLLLSYFVKKLTTFTLPISSVIKTLVGAVLTLILIFFLKSILILPPWPEALAVTIAGLVFYGTWILITKAITRDDLRLIAQVIPMPEWLVRFASKIVKS